MIPTLNHDDKEWWDREMEKYQRRKKKEYRSSRGFLYWLTVTICLVIIFSTCHIRIGPDRPTPEQQMEDTISITPKTTDNL